MSFSLQNEFNGWEMETGDTNIDGVLERIMKIGNKSSEWKSDPGIRIRGGERRMDEE